jgi:hypothetical protein
MGKAGQARPNRARWLAALGALLAGLVAFGAGEAVYRLIAPELVLQTFRGRRLMLSTYATEHTAAAKNAALAFGALGLCLAGFLGMAGGLARRSAAAAAGAGLAGAVLGLALGAGLTRALLPLSLRAQLDYRHYDLIISLVTHGLIWGLLGASAGVAFAVGLGERRQLGRALSAGFIGAALGAVAFDVIGAVFFPMAVTAKPISVTWPTRLMARLLVTLGTAAALAMLLPAPSHDDDDAHQAEPRAPEP